MTARVWTQRADRLLRSLPRRSPAAPVFDFHRRRRADRDHAPVGLLAVAGTSSTPLPTTSRRTASRWPSPPTSIAAASTPNYDVILLPTCGCKPPRDITAANKADDDVAALQPGRPPPRVRAAAHPALLRRSRAADALRPQCRHHRRAHRELGSLGRRAGVGTRFAQLVRHHRRRRHAPRLSLPARRRRSPAPLTKDVSLRRAGAVRAMARAWSRSARASSSRRRWCRSTRAAARPPSSPTSTTRRSPRSTSRATRASPTRARGMTTSRCGCSIHPASIASEEVPGAHAAARRTAQRHHRRRAVALERARCSPAGVTSSPGTTSTARAASATTSPIPSTRTGSPCPTRTRSRPPTGSRRSRSSTATAWWPRARSYGGFLATTLLGRPHPFKALVAHAAVYDSFTQIGADYGAETERFFNFWDKPEEFAKIFAAHLGRRISRRRR